jgi:hypothetical protein
MKDLLIILMLVSACNKPVTRKGDCIRGSDRPVAYTVTDANEADYIITYISMFSGKPDPDITHVVARGSNLDEQIRQRITKCSF